MRTLNLSAREEILSAAIKYIGFPYDLHGDGINSFNCSQFVSRVMWDALGISLFARVDWIFLNSKIIKIQDLQPGDFIFCCERPRPVGRLATHIAIYWGDGLVINSRYKKQCVAIEPLNEIQEDYDLLEIRDPQLCHDWLNEVMAKD